VLLGTSVESVRRRIKTGKLHAFHDHRGRLRVRASLPSSPAEPTAHIAELWEELKVTKGRLTAAASEAHELRQELGLADFHRREAQEELQSLLVESAELHEELATARDALKHTQDELAAMWRVMSSRQQRDGLTKLSNGNEAFDMGPAGGRFESERSRIQEQISRVRDLSKRRRWPWPQAS
jgi:chromosome segregation ATPase